MAVDKEKLRELASDPEATSASIAQALGVNSLYYEFQKDPTLKPIYEEERAVARALAAAGRQGSGKEGDQPKPIAKPAPTKKRASSSSPPPQRQCQGWRRQRTAAEGDSRIQPHRCVWEDKRAFQRNQRADRSSALTKCPSTMPIQFNFQSVQRTNADKGGGFRGAVAESVRQFQRLFPANIRGGEGSMVVTVTEPESGVYFAIVLAGLFGSLQALSEALSEATGEEMVSHLKRLGID
jgi:hypothetical protein